MDSIPYHFMKEKGFDRCLVILTQPLGFTKKKNSLLPLIRIFYRKYPKLVEAMGLRHVRYNEQVREVTEDEKKGLTLVIAPESSLNVKRTESDPAILERVYLDGRKVAEKRLDEIISFLEGQESSAMGTHGVQ